MLRPTLEDEDFTTTIDGYNRSIRTTKTIYSNGLFEVFFAISLAMILIPIGAFFISGAIVILRQVQTPPKCSVSLTTRYAVELGRFSDG